MPFLGKFPTQIVDPEVDIDGGAIDGVTIGATTASAATVTTLASGNITTTAAVHRADNTIPLIIDRLNSDGDILTVRRQGASLGGISSRGTAAGDLLLFLGSAGLTSDILSGQALLPTSNAANPSDDAVNLGSSSNRFKNLYLSGAISSGSNVGAKALAVASGGVQGLQMQQARGSVTSPTSSATNGDGNYIVSEVYNGSAFAKIGQIGMVTGSAIDDGEMLFSTASSGTTTERMRIDSSGNVGIGTSNPSVYGGLVLVQDANTSSNGFAVIDSTLAQSAKLWCNGVNAYLSSGNTGSDPLILNAGGGNVGIGTSSPVDYLDVKASGNDQRVIRISHPTAPADACAFLGFVDTGTGTNTGVALGVQYSSTYYNAITIDRVTRNVRIGTETAAPNPDALLHLHKNVNAGNVPFGDEASQVISTNATAAGVQGYIGSLFFGTQDISSATQYAWRAAGIAAYLAGDLGTGGATADLLFYTANASQTPTEKMRITSGGNVGIGTTSPTFTSGNGLEIQRSDSATIRVERTGTTASAGEFFAGNGKVVLAATSNSPLQLRTNGTERMRISAGGNVGIGITTDPSAVISSSKILQLASTGNATLSVTSTDGVNDRSAILELLSSGNGLSKSIILYGDTDTSPSSPSPLVFQKYHSGARAEVARFTSTGNLRLGDSTSAFIDIKSGIGTNNGGIRWRFNSDSSVYGSLSLPYDTRATTGLHLYSGYPITYTVPSNKAHQFVTGSSEAARIDADGIKFNGDTAGANALDDYEEGTFTPAFTTGGTLTINSATYTKIGRQVTCCFHLTASTTCTGDINGLPFTPSGESGGVIGYQTHVSSQVLSVLVQAANVWNLRLGATQYGLAAGKQIRGMFTYFTNS